ncbi:uncharacterized protein [Drosophila tropicalis]|uniref:uncharacterized protein isoform X2 n=1 Tax=Drosophila tropicalis TaxID=46794 RepID=UPI0035ABBB66
MCASIRNKNHHQRITMLHSGYNVIIALIWFSNCCWAYFNLEVGDPCATSYRSSCQPEDECRSLAKFIESGQLTAATVLSCGFTVRVEKVCCPLDEVGDIEVRAPYPVTRPTTTTTTTTTSTTPRIITTTTTKTTTTEAPFWLNIFNTNREYVQRSVPVTKPPSLILSGREEEDACSAPLYEGKCLAISKCPSVEPLISQGRLRDDDFTTCNGGTTEEIICCPTNLPIQARGPIAGEKVTSVSRLDSSQETLNSPASTNDVDELDAAAIAKADKLLPHYNHLAALAYPNAAFDGHVYECTALALTPDLLVSGAGCQRPSHAVFGVADLRDVDVDEDYLVDIRLAHHLNDLALMRLLKPLVLGTETSSNVTLAPICSQFELTRLQASGELVAVAWGKGNNTDCPLYELPMRLVPTSDCADLTNLGNVQGLSATHLCVEPKNQNDLNMFSRATKCAPCPAVVGSILHLIRPNGNRCVLGLATPTGAECDARAMYFTSLLNPPFINFVEKQQRL